MKFHKNKLLTTVAAAALALAVGACSSSGDDEVAVSTQPTQPTTPVLTPAAQLAAAAAMEAATAAKEASDAAQKARENVATLQTGETSGGLAQAASAQAKAAADAAVEAQTASDAAAEATDGVTATRFLVAAETARDKAVAAQGMAETQGAAAVAAAMAELMIVGKDKNVGETSINADAGASMVTTNGVSVITGLMKDMNPEANMVGGVVGQKFEPEDAPKPDTPYRQAVAARTFDIGKTVDSSDDMARLMLVNSYVGSKTVKVFAIAKNEKESLKDGTKAGYLSIGEDDKNVVLVPLKSEGTYYRAGVGEDGNLGSDDVVAAGAEGVEVFSYTDPSDEIKKHVVWEKTETTGTTTTYTYRLVDVTSSDAAAKDAPQVTAKIPEATDYKHIHFGVWAALGAAEKDGSQELSDLGIGFVQSIGDGLTGADMPNNGTANYSGDWAAAVQAEDEDGDGAISLVHGAATINADLSKATIKAILTGLATLEGAIDTNTFSGTKASGIDTKHGLDAGGKFTGSFSGGFYGKQAAEAGGIFDFTSEDAEDGAFRGAFGGNRTDN